MKKAIILPLFSFVIASMLLVQCKQKINYETVLQVDENNYTYESVTNDPMGLRIYTLENGLKVYISPNEDVPEIQTYIAFRTGSKYEPSDNTGISYQLLRMLFKGTHQMGTANWKEEEVYINQVVELFEKYRNTSDTTERKIIFAEIDSVSNIASEYAIANEVNKVLTSIGARGINGETGKELCVNRCIISSNELERWLMLEKERFSALVPRLYHTDIGTIYDLYNMNQDDDEEKATAAVLGELFKKHPYGTQTEIGALEHLTSPSIKAIIKHWKTYYVPNNMAICLSGDLNYERTIKLIDKYLGGMKPNKELPKFEAPVEDPISAPIEKTIYGSDAEFMYIAYRFDNNNPEEKSFVNLIDMVLSNGKAGLFDLNLIQEHKVLEIETEIEFFEDYGYHLIKAVPMTNQSVEDLQGLVVAEINKIANGDFEKWLLEAAINDMKVQRMNDLWSNKIRGKAFYNSFIVSSDWINYVKEPQSLEDISKGKVSDFAKKHYANNRVVILKKIGKDMGVNKIIKPQITPVHINRSAKSDFYKEIHEVPYGRLVPRFTDFKKEITRNELNSGIELNYIKNKSNDLFSLNYVIDVGTENNKTLPFALNYMMYLGTDMYSAKQLQNELFKLGLVLKTRSSKYRSVIEISGLEENFPKAVELLEHVINNVVPDDEVLESFTKKMIKERENDALDKDIVLKKGMLNYAKFGEESPFTYVLSTNDLKRLDASELTNSIKVINNYYHRIFYYGTNDIGFVENILNKDHKVLGVKGHFSHYPAREDFVERELVDHKVYFYDYEMVQANIYMFSRDVSFDESLIPYSKVFRRYFGQGLASIVMQEIRESKSLAQSAYANYTIPSKSTGSHYSTAFVSTSPDKIGASIEVMQNLLNNLPRSDQQFKMAKESILKEIESARVIKEDIFWKSLRNEKLGLDEYVGSEAYKVIKDMTFEEFEVFFQNHISSGLYSFLIIGDKDNIDMKTIEGLGEIEELEMEDIFNN